MHLLEIFDIQNVITVVYSDGDAISADHHAIMTWLEYVWLVVATKNFQKYRSGLLTAQDIDHSC